MKKLIVSLSILIGIVGVSHASRNTGGWRPYTLSVSSAQIFVGSGYLGQMILSTGCNTGDYIVAYDTMAVSTTTGLGFTNVADLNVGTTTVITPAIVFGSTTTGSVGLQANNYWAPGQAEDDYIEINNGLFVWKTVGALGQCGKVTIYYAR